MQNLGKFKCILEAGLGSLIFNFIISLYVMRSGSHAQIALHAANYLLHSCAKLHLKFDEVKVVFRGCGVERTLHEW